MENIQDCSSWEQEIKYKKKKNQTNLYLKLNPK